jgi:peptide/nickel transport system permease protein
VRARRWLQRDRLTLIGTVLFALLFLVALVGPLLPIGSPVAFAGPRLAPPSGHFLAGTDTLGRSLLPRLVEGVRTTLLIAGISVALSAAVGVFIGMIAAYLGGILDEVVVRAADVLFVFPGLILGLLVVAIVGPGETGAIVSIALITVPMMVRVVRAAALQVVNRDFVIASRVGGASRLRVVFTHVLPNVAGAAIVQATYVLSVAMLIESGLSFLGLGVQPPAASLGSLVNEGSLYLPIAPWLVLIPGAALALLIISVNLIGDGLRDALDVRATEVRR